MNKKSFEILSIIFISFLILFAVFSVIYASGSQSVQAIFSPDILTDVSHLKSPIPNECLSSVIKRPYSKIDLNRYLNSVKAIPTGTMTGDILKTVIKAGNSSQGGIG